MAANVTGATSAEQIDVEKGPLTTPTSATATTGELECCGKNCLSHFAGHFQVYFKQLTQCDSAHKEEEKVGLLWFKNKDTAGKLLACGAAVEPPHHCFLSWLVLTVWAQAICAVVYLLLVLIIPFEVTNGALACNKRAHQRIANSND
eukprot:SAG22_NODE_1984_length_3206_cov_2.186675_4_plen_147_part_00